METKTKIRNRLLASRANLPCFQRFKANYQIFNHSRKLLKQHPEWQKVGFYAATKREVATKKIIVWALRHHRQVYLPVCDSRTKTMIFKQIQKFPRDCGLQAPFGFFQPRADCQLLQTPLTTLFLPVVGFDDQLNRLGQGHGYYDRWLNQQTSGLTKIGLAYQLQFTSQSWKVEKHDQSLDFVITETQIWRKPQQLKI